MATATGRYLPLVFGFVVLALLGLGCLERAKGTSRTEPTLSKQAIVSLAGRSITTAGMPEPPLRKDSTRAERKEYLSAAQGALEQLKTVGAARSDNMPRSAKLMLDDQSEQVLAISRLLAVELADAIDRSDPRRALSAIQIASDYAKFVSSRSVPDRLASAAIADNLAVGVKSVAAQLDTDLADTLVKELSKLEAQHGDLERVLMGDANRIDD